MPHTREDWSDSEDEFEYHQEGYTSVHLGIPSEPIKEVEDLRDPHVSRIGGTPVRRITPRCLSHFIDLERQKNHL